MVGAARDAVAAAVVGIGVLVLTGCVPGQDIDVTNAAEDDVRVQLAAGDVPERVSADGGMSVLDVTTCYDGPVRVTYADGRRVGLDASVCPGDLVAVSERGAKVVRAADRPESSG